MGDAGEDGVPNETGIEREIDGVRVWRWVSAWSKPIYYHYQAAGFDGPKRSDTEPGHWHPDSHPLAERLRRLQYVVEAAKNLRAVVIVTDDEDLIATAERALYDSLDALEAGS